MKKSITRRNIDPREVYWSSIKLYAGLLATAATRREIKEVHLFLDEIYANYAKILLADLAAQREKSSKS